VCNLYIDKAADPDLAESLTVNAKCQRPSVCNAVENLIIHADAAPALLPRLCKALRANGVELRADERAGALLNEANIESTPASDEDYRTEFLDLILAVKVVDDIDEGIDFINTYGSAHSDAIVTADEANARRFMQGVDSATVYWNASTRFTDGFEFGLGAEIGISTDRLHARGPMGLRELCTYKFLVFGTGQTRH
jgi:glutamate-5-semialdehyde dehydrogenase